MVRTDDAVFSGDPEIDELNRIVVMWLDFAVDQARRGKQVFVKDWEQRLGSFEARRGDGASPGPLFSSRGRLGYTFFRLFAFLSAMAVSVAAESRAGLSVASVVEEASLVVREA